MITLSDGGEVLFELYLPHAQDIQVLGDFTGWEASPMRMSRQTAPEDGWWQVRHKLAPGEYSFSYLVDGRSWMPDYAAAGVRRNAYGRWTSLLTVAGTPAPIARAVVAAPALPRVRPDREERERIVQECDAGREFSTSGLSGRRHTS